MTLVLRRATAVAMLLLVGVLGAGCSNKKLNPLQASNVLPVVRVTSAPIDTNATCTPDAARSCYSLTFDWVGYDVDGRVDHYIYAVDPPDDADTTWIVTSDNEKRLVFSAPSTSPRADSLTILRGFHVFVIAAVDNDGAVGPRVDRAFFSFTKAPTVLLDPTPVKSVVRTLPPSIRIKWKGTDEDGVFTTKPVRYKYLLLGPGNESSVIPGGINAIFSSGGSAIRRYYAPEFRTDQGWTAVGGDTTSVQFTDLVPGATYLFTVVAFDEAGAFSPVFLFDTNIMRFTIGFAAAFGPTITVFNESFFFTYAAAYNPLNEVRIEVPAKQAITFRWFGTPPLGADIVAYRWMLDGDVFDERPRVDESRDTRFWSTPSASTLSATIGPFTTAGDHFFYVDAEDNTGLKSLAVVHFFVVVPTFSKSLLVVDDTRYEPDSYLGNGTRSNYGRPWPAAAELDTFMYAVGGVPWRGYPEGTTTSPGVFHGYDFDTIGTRKGIADLSTSLATLGGYRHVVWLVDFQSATFGASGNVPIDPMTSLRYMSIPGHLNSLGAFIRMGGEAWLVGGGGAFSTLISFDDITNNGGGGSYIWNSTSAKPELVPGRFMYDATKWQSVIRDRTGIQITNNVLRSLGRFTSNPGVYANVPASFDRRLTGQDALPPGRVATQYYLTSYACEFINSDNIILETVNGDPIDFKIDSFDDADPAPMIARWYSRDSLNTIVTQGDVTAAGTTKAALHSLKIHTQGGGASLGDTVARTFEAPRDWSGLNSFKFNLKQDQPVSAVQWRVRAVDVNGASASVLVDPGVTNTFVDVVVPQAAFVNDATSSRMIDWFRIGKLQFEAANTAAPGNSEFDNVEVITLPEGPALDTLLAAKLSFGADPPVNATMTVYHGHDFARPFIFTGFAPWNFRLGQCQQLFDFVLQRMWGLPKTTGSFVTSRPAPFLPAHQITRRPSVVTGVSGAVLRQEANLGALQRRNGNP